MQNIFTKKIGCPSTRRPPLRPPPPRAVPPRWFWEGEGGRSCGHKLTATRRRPPHDVVGSERREEEEAPSDLEWVPPPPMIASPQPLPSPQRSRIISVREGERRWPPASADNLRRLRRCMQPSPPFLTMLLDPGWEGKGRQPDLGGGNAADSAPRDATLSPDGRVSPARRPQLPALHRI